MSLNITIHAVARATLSLKSGRVLDREIENSFSTWQTPTDLTRKIVENGDLDQQIQLYKDWVLDVGNVPCGGVRFDKDDITVHVDFDDDLNMVITGNSVRPDTRTMGERHVEELDEWLAEHDGWNIIFSYL